MKEIPVLTMPYLAMLTYCVIIATLLPPLDDPPRPSHQHQMDGLTLWCYVQGDHTYFDVSISSSQTVSRLKEMIHTKRRSLFGSCDAPDLILLKVRYIMISM
jgi:hypothetical protein